MSFRTIYCGAWNFQKEISGIKAFKMDPVTAKIEEKGIYGTDLPSQSILTIAGDKLIAVSEQRSGGKIASYKILADGGLEQADMLTVDSTLLSYVIASPDYKYAFTSSMGNGTVRMIRIEEDGTLKLTDEFRVTGHSVTPRQSKAQTHSVMISPDGKFLAAANLGADEVELFRVDYEKERLCLLSSAPVDFGKEPRHMAFHPSGKAFYLLTESGNRLYVFRTEENTLQELAVYSTLDPMAEPVGKAADLVISADGRFLYSTNRGQHNIAVWRVMDSGLLDIVGFFPSGGEGPRGLHITADGMTLLCANNDNGTVTAMPLDPDTGVPGAVFATLDVPGAGCVRSI